MLVWIHFEGILVMVYNEDEHILLIKMHKPMFNVIYSYKRG